MQNQSFLYQLGSLIYNFPRIIKVTTEDVAMKVTCIFGFFLHRDTSEAEQVLMHV